MSGGREEAAELEPMVNFPLFFLHSQSGWLHAQGTGAAVTLGLWALSLSAWAVFSDVPAAQRALGLHFANLQPDSVPATQQLLGDKGDSLRGCTWQLPCAAPLLCGTLGTVSQGRGGRDEARIVLAQLLLPP